MSTELLFRTARARRAIYRAPQQQIKRYLRYWRNIVPTTHEDYYLRWLFAFMSIRTTWRANVMLFNAVRALPLRFTRRQLSRMLTRERSGLFHMRMEGLTRFQRDFWRDPESWYVQSGESFPEARDRLCDRTYGLGLAKTSFVLEMAYPETCQVVCCDTHIKQLYGLGPEDSIPDRLYRRMEKHWVTTCNERGLPSPQVRNFYWDTLRGESTSRYWSYILET